MRKEGKEKEDIYYSIRNSRSSSSSSSSNGNISTTFFSQTKVKGKGIKGRKTSRDRE